MTKVYCRSFKKEHILFIQSLMKYNIPIVFLITHCESEHRAKDEEMLLNEIMAHKKLYPCHVCSLNLDEPLVGYPNLFMLLYKLFKPHKINTDLIGSILDEGDIQRVIDTSFKPTIFFNNISDSLSLYNPINNQADELISSFIAKKYYCYLISSITGYINLYSNIDIELFRQIGLLYDITLEDAAIQNLITQWGIET